MLSQGSLVTCAAIACLAVLGTVSCKGPTNFTYTGEMELYAVAPRPGPTRDCGALGPSIGPVGRQTEIYAYAPVGNGQPQKKHYTIIVNRLYAKFLAELGGNREVVAICEVDD